MVFDEKGHGRGLMTNKKWGGVTIREGWFPRICHGKLQNGTMGS